MTEATGEKKPARGGLGQRKTASVGGYKDKGEPKLPWISGKRACHRLSSWLVNAFADQTCSPFREHLNFS